MARSERPPRTDLVVPGAGSPGTSSPPASGIGLPATVFRLREHIDRLYESARTLDLEIPLTPEEMIQATLETVAAKILHWKEVLGVNRFELFLKGEYLGFPAPYKCCEDMIERL